MVKWGGWGGMGFMGVGGGWGEERGEVGVGVGEVGWGRVRGLASEYELNGNDKSCTGVQPP